MVRAITTIIGVDDTFHDKLVSGWNTSSKCPPKEMLIFFRDVELPNFHLISFNFQVRDIQDFFHDTVVSRAHTVCAIVSKFLVLFIIVH